MNKYLYSILLLFISVSQISSASNYYCTEWTKSYGVTCIFAGKGAKQFVRQCENPCWTDGWGGGNWGPGCDREQVCFFENPSSFQYQCSDWYKVHGVTCQNPNTGRWESQWQRACTVGLREIWCSNEHP